MAKIIHITHIVYHFGTGGLENGIVNLINHLPADTYRHSIVCLSGFDPEFFKRVKQPVHIESIGKAPGADWKYYWAMWRVLRRLKPDIVHTRNMATMEYQIPAFFAWINHRIHGEHGWDMSDLNGANTRYAALKKLLKPLIHDFIGLSGQAVDYLLQRVEVPADRCHRIINGVDIQRFSPEPPKQQLLPEGFADKAVFIIGTVGRLAQVKNQQLLADAFISLCLQHPQTSAGLRLVLIGDGELFEPLRQQISNSGLSTQVWMAGNRSDIPELMRQMDLFVLPSLAEGISNTLLEAMASGLPCIATDVGGNSELIVEGITGTLIPSQQVEPLTAAIASYWIDPERLKMQSTQARQRAVAEFSLETMVARYGKLYCARTAHRPTDGRSICAE